MFDVKIRCIANAEELHTSPTHLCFMVPHTHTAVVQTGQHPWLGRMKVYAFDTVRSSREFALDVQPERLEEKNQNHFYITDDNNL